jgi:hypothetical protein
MLAWPSRITVLSFGGTFGDGMRLRMTAACYSMFSKNSSAGDC